MTDIAAGSRAKLVIKSGETYRLSTGGVAEVTPVYGASIDKTTVSSGFYDIGPFPVEAKVLIKATTGPASYTPTRRRSLDLDPSITNLEAAMFLAGGASSKLTCAALNGAAHPTAAGQFPSNGTLSFWVWLDPKPGADSFLFGTGTASRLSMRLRQLNSSIGRNNARLELRNAGGNTDARDLALDTQRMILLQLRWTTSDPGARQVEAFVDGIKVYNWGPQPASWNVTQQDFSFGESFFSGYLADIQLYSRVLSDADLAAAGVGKTQTNLMARWLFTDTQYGPAAVNCQDSSGNSRSLLIGDFDNNSDTRTIDRNFSKQSRGYSYRVAPKKVLKRTPRRIKPEYHGEHFLYAPEGSTKPDPRLVYGLARSHDWSPTGPNLTAWYQLESTKGNWNWSNIDLWVDHHWKAGRDMIYVAGFSPPWAVAGAASGTPGYANYNGQPVVAGAKSNMPPDNDADWINYLQQVCNRYMVNGRCKIKYWQVWNEPESPSQAYYGGTPERMSRLVWLAKETLQAIDPSIQIIQPSCSAWFAQYNNTQSLGQRTTKTYYLALDTGGRRMVDAIDICGIHGYDPANNGANTEEIVERCRELNAEVGRPNLPIWMDEIGTIQPNLNDSGQYTSDQKRLIVCRQILSTVGSGVDRIVFFCADAGQSGFMQDRSVHEAVIDLWEFLYSGDIEPIVKAMDGTFIVTVNGVTRYY
jgi:hypothetical protein